MASIRRRSLLSGFVGASAALTTSPAFGSTTPSPRGHTGRGGRVREYWLQVEARRHNVVPSRHDAMSGQKVTTNTTITALVYRAYTSGWGRPLPGDTELGPNTGFPGPVLRAEVGDTMVVHLRNADTHYRQPHSLHLHGVRYAPDSDGAWTAEHPSPGAAVPVGGTYTYTYQAVPSSAGTWPYHDHSVPFSLPTADGTGMGLGDGVMEIGAQLGLMGHVVVTEPGEPRPDQEIYLVFHDLYAADIPEIAGDIDCFNGYAFLGNTPTFSARVGEHVRWHVIALGTEFHVFHLHGHRWRGPAGQFVDSLTLGPSTSLVADYVEDNPGRWLYHCHVVDHMMGGMVGWYDVSS